MTFLYEQMGARQWVPPWLKYQNRCRYDWAAKHVHAKRVVEVGCGSGNGTQMLIDAGATSVLALDVSHRAIALAKERHPTKSIRFDVADATALPAAQGSFDIAVALEVIEHIENDHAFVAEIARVLAPNGRLLCSTPNRLMTNPGTRISDAPFNRHHVREYSAEEFRNVLSASFNEVELLGQSFYSETYRSCLGAVGAIRPLLASRVHQAVKLIGMPFDSESRHHAQRMRTRQAPEVLLAVCGAPRR